MDDRSKRERPETRRLKDIRDRYSRDCRSATVATAGRPRYFRIVPLVSIII